MFVGEKVQKMPWSLSYGAPRVAAAITPCFATETTATYGESLATVMCFHSFEGKRQVGHASPRHPSVEPHGFEMLTTRA